MPLLEGAHAELLRDAIASEGRAQRALLAGDLSAGRDALREASRLYRASWEAAPPASYGRLIGALKAAIIAGDGPAEATYVREQVPPGADSPPACYALAMAALVAQDDPGALVAAEGMRAGSPAFVRAAAAISALAAGDRDSYAAAIDAIVADFERRDEHLTGVRIADTAVMLERLAAGRGLACRPASPLVPAIE